MLKGTTDRGNREAVRYENKRIGVHLSKVKLLTWLECLILCSCLTLGKGLRKEPRREAEVERDRGFRSDTRGCQEPGILVRSIYLRKGADRHTHLFPTCTFAPPHTVNRRHIR